MSEPSAIRRLLADHVQVVALLDRLDSELAGPVPAFAPAVVPDAARFFERELPLHIDQEEDAFFPPLEVHLGHDSGPCAVMRAEHEEISNLGQEFLRLAGGDLTEATWRRLERVSRAASDLLRSHLFKEEHILFPMSQQLLSEEAFAVIDERMTALERVRAA